MREPIEARILGPIEVGEGGRQLTPPPGKPRALLAVLLLRANRFVSTAELIDALWGDEPPATARHSLEVHVSRVRSALGASGSRLETRPGGYQLTLLPGELDWSRFGELVERARQALAAGDVAGAERRLLEANGLWRGSGLDDVAGAPFAGPAIAQLEAARLAAIEDRIELSLALGRHADAAVELEALVASEPFRERLRGLLMLALFRCGRQADALRAYHEARTFLADELGLDPGADLQDLQLRILQQDASLLAPAPSPGTPLPDGAVTAVPALPERKLVTVLLARSGPLAGPGPAAAGRVRDPERPREPELVAALQRAFTADVVAELEPHGATVERLPHGVVMAVFGSPIAQEDHADRALRAAVAIADRLAAGPAGADRAAIGIETGEVIVTSRSGEGADVSGTAIEQAARFERAARVGEILAGPRVLGAARAPVRLSPPVTIQGVGAARRVMGGADQGRRLAPGEPEAERPFVARERELAFLDAAYERVVHSGEPHLVTVLGEAGIGKSSLVRRIVNRLADLDTPPTVRRGRCLAYGRGITYAPMADVLRQEVALVPGDPPAVVRERLGGRSILGLTLGLEPDEALHPLAARNRLETAWTSLIDEALRAGPMVVVVEDLHWAEEPLLDLLERIVDDARGPLLILAPARPEFAETHAAWVTGHANRSTLWLEPLGTRDAGELVTRLLGGNAASVAAGAIERAEGNPFFLEEILAALAEQGNLRRADDEWQLLTTGGQPMPDSVRAVLAARLDLLDRRDKEVVQAASVVGRRFTLAEVESLTGGEPVDLAPLARRDFVRRLPMSLDNEDVRYSFKHALTRDVAYGSLPLARRARLHEAYAARLERMGGGRDEDAALIAYHAFEAIRPGIAPLRSDLTPEALETLRANARRWQIRAAELATGRYAIEEAVALLEHALELEPPVEERARVLLMIGRANAMRYDGIGFWDAMQRASEVAASDEERGAIFAELAFETTNRWAIWKRMPDRALVDDWITRALALAAPESRARALALVARAYWHPNDSADEAAEALRLAERLGDPVEISYALDARAVTAFVAGEDRAAAGWWLRRAELADRIPDLDHVADVHGAAIAGHIALGRVEEARAAARRHDEVAMQLSRHHQVHAVAMQLELEELTGDWQRILDLTDRTEGAVAANAGTPCARNQRSLLSCAVAAAIRGESATAAQLEAASDAWGMEGYDVIFNTLRVRLAILRGDREAMRRLMPSALPLPNKNWWRLTTILARLDALLELGEDELVAAEARRLVVPGTYLEPFARRSLAIVRRDERELEAVIGGFASAGQAWHAAESRRLWDAH